MSYLKEQLTMQAFLDYIEKEGDEQACRLLCHLYQEDLTTYAKSRAYPWINDPEGEAIEVIGDFWKYVKVKLTRGEVDQLLKIDSIKAYLIKMLNRQLIRKKLQSRAPLSDIPEEIIDIFEEKEEREEKKIAKAKKQQLIKSAWPYLTKKQQEILKLFYYDRLQHKEIKDIMGFKSSSVSKVTLSRALKKLKKIVNDLNSG